MHTPPHNSALAAWRCLAVRRGLLPGVLHGKRFSDFAVLMAAAALAFEERREFSEADVNAVLKDWLAGAGAMLATDHVELRRWLVDDGWLERDGYGWCYRRTVPSRGRSAVLAELATVDLAAVAAAERADDARRRALRKANWNRAHRQVQST